MEITPKAVTVCRGAPSVIPSFMSLSRSTQRLTVYKYEFAI